MYPVFHPSSYIDIPLYLIVMSLAATVSVVYFYMRAIQMHLSPKLSTEISIVVMVGTFIGARLFHIIFEYPQYYWDHPVEIFKFYKGGFVFYGGLFGGTLASYLYVKKLRQNYWNWLDCSALVLPVGYIIGRVGCILSGCCYGKACDLPWAITFPEGVEAPAHVLLHPTQAYAILAEAAIWVILFFVSKDPKKKKPGQLFLLWLFLHAIARLIIEQFRGDFRGEPILGLSISSLISLLLILVSGLTLYKRSLLPKS